MERRGRSASRSPGRSMSRSRSYSRSPSRSPPPRRGRSASYSSRSPSPRRGASDPKTILIKRLTKNVRLGHIEEIFGVYGVIKDVDLPINRRTGFHRGSATVTYDTTEAADKAIDCMDRGMLDSNDIDVLPGRRGDALPPLPPPAAPAPAARERSLSPYSRRLAMSGGGHRGGRAYAGGVRRGPPPHPRGRSLSRSPPPARRYSRSPPPRRRRSPSFSRSRSRSFSPPPRRRRESRSPPAPPSRRGPPVRGGGGAGGGRRPSPEYGNARSPPRRR